MNSSQLVDPRDSDGLVVEVCHVLTRAGLHPDDASWLAHFLFSPGLFDLPELEASPADAESFVSTVELCLASGIRQHSQRASQLGSVLFELVGLGHGSEILLPREPARFPRSQLIRWDHADSVVFPHWIANFLEQSQLEVASLLKLLTPDSIPHRQFVYHVMLPRLQLHQSVDWNRLPFEKRTKWSNKDLEHFEMIEFWLNLEFEMTHGSPGTSTAAFRILPKVLPFFESLSKEQLSAHLIGLLHSLENVMSLNHLNPFGDGFRVYSNDLAPYYQLLEATTPAKSDNQPVRHAWRYLATRTFGPKFGAASPSLTATQLAALVQCARADLGGLRTILRDRPQECDWTFPQAALETILSFGSTWDALSLLLQAFRALKTPAVTADLRYWNEPHTSEKASFPIAFIPMWIATSLYQRRLQLEREQDPTLVALREAFATYCLKRLKTREDVVAPKISPGALTNDDFLEPSVWWRRCYAKAIRELRVNPRGKAHHILHWSSLNDPDELVRAYSREAYISVRHDPALADTMSPRRPLMAAFWWLRQAHRFELGLPVDPEGAQRTRTKELRRIKETELTQ